MLEVQRFGVHDEGFEPARAKARGPRGTGQGRPGWRRADQRQRPPFCAAWRAPLLLLAAFGLWVGPGYPLLADELPPEVRRIVTVPDGPEGARVLADGASNNVRVLNGSRITRLWETTELPVPLDVTADAGADAGNAYREGFVGTSLYVADIPPGSDLSDVPLHAQDSLDYIAILEGEIDLVLPGETRTLKAGDVLVQAGNIHSWINRSDNYCRMLVVVLTGTRSEGG